MQKSISTLFAMGDGAADSINIDECFFCMMEGMGVIVRCVFLGVKNNNNNNTECIRDAD